MIGIGVTDADGPTLQALSAFRRVPKQQTVSNLDETRRVAADSLHHDTGESNRDGVFFRPFDFHPGPDAS
ncbi:MAG: hypothetical protein OXH11_21200 [Candidatus Aminicenantes bacterium]|nr:hypothetical protein [Candidatus Aminicenantes bacterium]